MLTIKLKASIFESSALMMLLITIISSEKLIELESFGISYSELDQCTSSDKFSILSSKKDYDWTSIFGSEKIVYEGTNFVIVKNISLKPEEASLNGFKIVELNRKSTYKNEKRIWDFDRLQLSDSLITQITSSVNPDSVRFVIQSLAKFSNQISLR